jgi:serine/threonine protein phosphatase PrpC
MAKMEQYGGNIKVVVAVPEIHSFKLNESQHDFIMIASDGIFDRLNTEDVI